VATEKAIETLKKNVYWQLKYSLLYIVTHIEICRMLVTETTKVDTKLTKIVLFCSRFKLNEP
jgi:hypothetical protein